MVYDRNTDGRDRMDYGRDYGTGRDYTASSARDYAAAGDYRDDTRRGYGARDYGYDRYAERDRTNRDRGGYGADRGAYGGRAAYGERGGYADRDTYGDRGAYGDRGDTAYHGSYASDGRRFEDVGRMRHADDDRYHDPDRAYEARGRAGQRDAQRGYGRQPQGYDYQDRGFLQRAGDEVRSWLGDEDAERRREADARYDEKRYDNERDDDYRSWRSSQVAAFDRDYDEYRTENRGRFHNEFSAWRTNRQGQRDQLTRVAEHMDVVGSDGAHVGTVDKVRGDRILLTKNDPDAGGHHHSIPSNWIGSVDDKVTLTKTADEAKAAWRDEENSQALFGYGDKVADRTAGRSGTRDEARDSVATRTGDNSGRY